MSCSISRPCAVSSTVKQQVSAPARRATSRRGIITGALKSAVKESTGFKKNKLGASDLYVTDVCLGTMTFGEQNTEKEAHQQLSYAASMGVNFLDTAEIYPVIPRSETAGRTSQYIGSWLKNQKREDFVVASKVSGREKMLTWIPANRTDPRSPEKGGTMLDGPSIRAAVDAELRRLQTDYLDILQFHWPDRYTPRFGKFQYHADQWSKDTVSFEEQVDAVGQLIKQGKIRHWGLSNETSYGVMTHVVTARNLGVPPPISIQNHYSMLSRGFEGDLAEVCAPHHMNVALLVWSPLCGGSLSGKYLDGQCPPGSRFSLSGNRYSRFNSPLVQEPIKKYVKIAVEHGMTPSQLALRFCRDRWFVGSTIIGATTMAQLEEDLAAFLAPPLEPAVMEKVEAVHLQMRNPALMD